MLTAAVAALVILRPGRAFKWIARAALVTSLLRRVVKAVDHGNAQGHDLGLGADKSQPPERFGA